MLPFRLSFKACLQMKDRQPLTENRSEYRSLAGCSRLRALRFGGYCSSLAVVGLLLGGMASLPPRQSSCLIPSAEKTYIPVPVSLVDELDLSPDGKSVVFIEYTSLGDARRTLRIADGKAGKSISGYDRVRSPLWSPDGLKIAAIDGKAIRFFDASLQPVGMLSLPEEPRLFRWSPDGVKLAIVLDEKKAVGIAGNAGLYIADLRAAEIQPRRVSSSELHVSHALSPGIGWAPDSRSLAFAATSSSFANDWIDSRLYVINTDSGDLKVLAGGGLPYFSPLFTPDGEFVFAVKGMEGPQGTRRLRVVRINVASGEEIGWPITPDASPNIIGWSQGRLVVSETSRTIAQIGLLDRTVFRPAGGQTKLIRNTHLIPVGRPVSVNNRGTHVAAIVESANSPSEIAILNLKNGRWQTLRNVNRHVPGMNVQSKIVQWTNSRGERIEGILTLPPGHSGSHARPLPLVTLLHGGPPNVAQDQYVHATPVFPIGALVDRGYAVFRPNFTGSLGYGPEFRTALVNRVGIDDADDVLSGIDYLTKTGVADAQRLALGGWSYGGYLAGMIVRGDGRFKGVSIGAAPANLSSYVATSDLPDLFVDYLGGARPFDDPAKFAAASPALVRSLYNQTPVLLQHGLTDARVPFGQAQENHFSFAHSGHAVRLSAFPAMGHMPIQPSDAVAVATENLSFFDCVLRPLNRNGQ
jgi:dipeptidyl aminopeptidase/acylaminoacyl peptidase